MCFSQHSKFFGAWTKIWHYTPQNKAEARQEEETRQMRNASRRVCGGKAGMISPYMMLKPLGRHIVSK